MMDYEPVHVELYSDKPHVENRYVDVKCDMLIKAIGQEQDFAETEFQFRIYFEHFLTALSRYNYFLDSGAIEPEELCADFA